MQGDESSLKQPSSEERVAVRKEALKLISNLSGDIAAKASKQGLKMYSVVELIDVAPGAKGISLHVF